MRECYEMKKSLMLLMIIALMGMMALSGCGSKDAGKPAEPAKE